MVRLQIYQKKGWLLARKKRLKWQETHPNKSYPTRDPFPTSISRYDCALCGERYYYYVSATDRDAPQYHKHKTVWMVICHACWHLKDIYKKHQDAHSPEGLSGCRFCQLQLAGKRARKRNPILQRENGTDVTPRHQQSESSAADWEPTRVRRSVGLSAGRNRRTNAQKSRSR
jgi:hypothetical protein